METTQQNKSTFEKIYDVHDFYAGFSKEYTPHEMGIGKQKRGREKPSFLLYKSILITFFDIHAKELYFTKKNMYHILGGDIMKTVTSPKVLKFHNGQAPIYKKPSIGLIWYNKPSGLLAVKMNFKKAVGSTNKLGFIEKTFRKNCDIDLLPKFDVEINRLKPKKQKR